MVGLSSAPVVSIKPSRTASGRAFRAVCDYSRHGRVATTRGTPEGL